MLVAGCAGGRSLSSSPPAPVPRQTAVALANAARAYLTLTVPSNTAASVQRGPTSTQRHPSYVSPATSAVYIAAVSGGATVYSTQFNLSTCTSSYGTYNCVTSLPVGIYQIYAGLLDSSGNPLSTNFYTNVAPSTIYGNGSPYGNYVNVSTYGIWNRMFFKAPSGCFPAVAQQVPLVILDADNYPIVGPLANPVTISAATLNGAGTGAINLYGTYGATTIPLNGVTIYDTSVYQNPYVGITGAEGAVSVSVSTVNIPAYMPGMNSYTFGYTTTGPVYAAAGTYLAWGANNGGLYSIAVESSVHSAVTCGNVGTSFGLQYAGAVGSTTDPATGTPLLVVTDTMTNTVQILDAELTGTAHTYLNMYSGYAGMGPKANLRTLATFHPSNPVISVFDSNTVAGRIDVVSGNSPYGRIDLLDISGGAITDPGVYSFAMQIPATSNTWLTGAPSASALYYTNPGTAFLYGMNSSTGAAVPTMNMYPSPLYGGQIYAAQPSGAGFTNIFVRGSDPIGTFYLCAFDATAASSIYCHYTGSTNTNVASIRYDAGTGNLMFIGGGNGGLYAINAHLSPYNAINSFSGPSLYTFANGQTRFVASVATPGTIGTWCSVDNSVTVLTYGTSWLYDASFPWPNHRVALTYPH